MGMLKTVLVSAALATGMAVSAPAFAAYTYCPGTAVTTDREFGVEMTAGSFTVECVAWGAGNDPNSYPPFVYIDKDESPDQDAAPGIDESWFTITGLGSLGGTFKITADLTSQYTNFTFVLKSGAGQTDPDWAAFRLYGGTADTDWTGNWSITGAGNQALSHSSLFASTGDLPPDEIPEPAPIALMGLALAGIALARRRGKAKQAA